LLSNKRRTRRASRSASVPRRCVATASSIAARSADRSGRERNSRNASASMAPPVRSCSGGREGRRAAPRAASGPRGETSSLRSGPGNPPPALKRSGVEEPLFRCLGSKSSPTRDAIRRTTWPLVRPRPRHLGGSGLTPTLPEALLVRTGRTVMSHPRRDPWKSPRREGVDTPI
jgi:hypothetical protein